MCCCQHTIFFVFCKRPFAAYEILVLDLDCQISRAVDDNALVGFDGVSCPCARAVSPEIGRGLTGEIERRIVVNKAGVSLDCGDALPNLEGFRTPANAACATVVNGYRLDIDCRGEGIASEIVVRNSGERNFIGRYLSRRSESKVTSAVDYNSLSRSDGERSLLTGIVSPEIISSLTGEIQRRIVINKTGVSNYRRNSRPDFKRFRTPANAALTAIADADLLDIGGVISDVRERNCDEVVVSAGGLGRIADDVRRFERGSEAYCGPVGRYGDIVGKTNVFGCLCVVFGKSWIYCDASAQYWRMI